MYTLQIFNIPNKYHVYFFLKELLRDLCLEQGSNVVGFIDVTAIHIALILVFTLFGVLSSLV